MEQIPEIIRQNLTLVVVVILLAGYLIFQKNKPVQLPINKEKYANFVTNKGLLPDGKYIIRGGRNQRYCTDDPNGIICNIDAPGPREIFIVQHMKGEEYAIQGQRGNLWCGLTSTGVRCQAPTVRNLEVFKLHPLGNNMFGVQNVKNGKWCGDTGPGMVCDTPSMDSLGFQKFEFIPIRYNNIR